MGFTVLTKGAGIMKKFVLTVLAVAALAAPAAAQVGDISVYADAAGLSCSVMDNTAPFAFIDVYVIHKHLSGGATASQFRVDLTGGSTMSYSGQTEGSGMLLIGNANDDLSVAYGGCLSGDLLLVTVRYVGVGTSPQCSGIEVNPAPTAPIPNEVVLADCAFAYATVPTGAAIINENPGCICNVAVAETTWGAIKALYK
jgi:hypothetical protein